MQNSKIRFDYKSFEKEIFRAIYSSKLLGVLFTLWSINSNISIDLTSRPTDQHKCFILAKI